MEPKHQTNETSNVISLSLFRAKKALQKDGFEVVQNPEGKITLVIRLAK